MIKHYNIIHWY